jgi:hypothetical protein
VGRVKYRNETRKQQSWVGRVKYRNETRKQQSWVGREKRVNTHINPIMENAKREVVPTDAMKAYSRIRCTVPLNLNFGEWFEKVKYLFPPTGFRFEPPCVGAVPPMLPRLPSLIMTDR